MNLKEKIRTIPDFPKPGIQFKDIESITEDPIAFRFVIEQMAKAVDVVQIDRIVALDARGFLFGAALGYELKRPIVMARKKGKLGGQRMEETYALEYGEATVELQRSAIRRGDKVLIVDDLLATGGTAGAAAALVERMGGEVSLFAFVIELLELGGRGTLKDAKVFSLVQF